MAEPRHFAIEAMDFHLSVRETLDGLWQFDLRDFETGITFLMERPSPDIRPFLAIAPQKAHAALAEFADWVASGPKTREA